MNFLSALVDVGRAAGMDDTTIARLSDDMHASYTEPQRHYHTVEHIEAVLAHLDLLGAATITNRLAAFFHDVIYDPTQADNEERSAVLATTFLRAANVAQADDVAAIVRATAGHQLTAGLPDDAAAFLDADLAILGQSGDVYDAYVQAIRAEYAHVPDDDFRTGRAGVLRGFADRPTLFFTTAGQELWEAAARANIERELAALTA